MKKFILCLMLLPALFTSCYKDEGNYDYKELNEITVDTVGVKTSFVIDQYDSLVIEPKINFSLSALPETALSYRWIMYSDAWGKDETVAAFPDNLRSSIEDTTFLICLFLSIITAPAVAI